MTRPLACLSIAAALLAVSTKAQCLGPNSGVSATVTPLFTFFTAADEGRTIPAIPLGFNFPMAGALPIGSTPGIATHAFCSSNGELYLTNADYGIVRPINGLNFGVFGVFDWRGGAFGSPRLAAWTGDLDAGTGGTWGIYVDTSVANQATFYWQDVYDFGAFPAGSYSFSVTLYSTGIIDFSYSGAATFPAPAFGSVGVSIGNDVGTGAEVSSDLSAGADSGSLGLLFEEFFGLPNDLENRTLRLTPNGVGGFTSALVCTGAYHKEYGLGCYDLEIGNSSVYELFPDAAVASTSLTGNGVQFVPTANGYVVTWLPGGASGYLPPSITATALAPDDDGDDPITPSVPFALPGGGFAPDLTVSHNGIVTASLFGNNSFDFSPSGFDLSNALELAFYSWSDFRDNNTTPVPSGQIKYEEVGGVLYITWDSVDHWTDPQGTSPSTLQFQLNLASGEVRIVWVLINSDTTSFFGSAHLVGCTDQGVSVDPGSITLATGLPVVTSPDVILTPLQLSASPPPVFTLGGPTVPVTWTANNVPDAAPPFGIGISFLIFSVAPFPGGFDMGVVGMPGCNLNLLSLDVVLGMPSTQPTSSLTFAVPQPLTPGLQFYSQVLSLFPANSLPTGLNAFGGLLSNGVESYFNTY